MAVADVDDDGRLDVLATGGEPSRLHVFRATNIRRGEATDER
jgi:hypothetical protein